MISNLEKDEIYKRSEGTFHIVKIDFPREGKTVVADVKYGAVM